MTKTKWKNRIKKACEQAGTYRTTWDDVIDTLADILSRRDYAQSMLDGQPLVIQHTNKAGAKNFVKNPFYMIWQEQNQMALTYWRELGLTPSGLKKLNEEALQAQKSPQGLEAILASLDE